MRDDRRVSCEERFVESDVAREIEENRLTLVVMLCRRLFKGGSGGSTFKCSEDRGDLERSRPYRRDSSSDAPLRRSRVVNCGLSFTHRSNFVWSSFGGDASLGLEDAGGLARGVGGRMRYWGEIGTSDWLDGVISSRVKAGFSDRVLSCSFIAVAASLLWVNLVSKWVNLKEMDDDDEHTYLFVPEPPCHRLPEPWVT